MTDAPLPTDTPISTPTVPPPSMSDRVKAFIGDLARPFAIISTSAAASIAIVRVSGVVENGNDGAILIGAVGLFVGSLYGAKAMELASQSKHAAQVEIAKAGAGQ